MSEAHDRTHRPGLPLQAERLHLNDIVGRLESLGWDVEYATTSQVKVVVRPDPETGHAMQFSEFWLDWRIVNERLAYGIADDIADQWRTQLDVADPADGSEVAEAADRAMHMLWHLDERNLRNEMYAENGRLTRISRRVEILARRMLITPGMLREALRESTENPAGQARRR